MLRVLIVDDEESGRSVLKLLIEKHFPNLCICGVFSNITDAERLIRESPPDIALLDVKMEGGTGFDLLARIEKINFAVIFITAHEEYAMRAIKLSAVDYLLKPISKVDLEVAIQRSIEFIKIHSFYRDNINILLNNLSREEPEKTLVINKYSGEKILLKNIIYIKADSNYSIIYGTEKTHTISKTLKEIEEFLCIGNTQMIRIHKSHIVNMNWVEKVSGNSLKKVVKLKTGQELEVSKRRWLLLRERLRV